ncbi:Structural maintenance of chromosomes protein 1, partial [Coemansia guatemalensis]
MRDVIKSRARVRGRRTARRVFGIGALARIHPCYIRLPPCDSRPFALCFSLVQLELENFKSYRGQQVIGPFTSFTAVVGPNGAGKSNLMDAISFVLGVRSTHLRSSQLKDLVYRGRAAQGQEGGAIDEAGDQHGRRAWVRAVYEDDDGRTVTFQRSITGSGESEYRINKRVVSLNTYNQALEAQNILVKAKNFLVFQGDVEAVAAQSPKELT